MVYRFIGLGVYSPFQSGVWRLMSGVSVYKFMLLLSLASGIWHLASDIWHLMSGV